MDLVKTNIREEVMNSKIAGEGLKYFAKKAQEKDEAREVSESLFKIVVKKYTTFRLKYLMGTKHKHLLQVTDSLFRAIKTYSDNDFIKTLAFLNKANELLDDLVKVMERNNGKI